MKKLMMIVALLLISSHSALLYAQKQSSKKNTLFQLSILNALLMGNYDGSLSFKQLKRYGDFGLGTFDKLDGEMVAFDGQFYQINSQGHVKAVNNKMSAPFIMLTTFKAERSLVLNKSLSCQELYTFLDTLRSTANLSWAIKIKGDWSQLKTRSVHLQHKPYSPLSVAVEKQAVFEMQDVKATLVGFWLPSYLASVNSAGYHFHALTANKKAGGHVLDCRINKAIIELTRLSQFQMLLPKSFETLNLPDSKVANILKNP